MKIDTSKIQEYINQLERDNKTLKKWIKFMGIELVRSGKSIQEYSKRNKIKDFNIYVDDLPDKR